MNRRLRLRGTAEGKENETEKLLRLVDARILKAVEAVSERQVATEQALHTIAVILKDMHNSALLAATDEGSVTRRLEAFLESFSMAMANKRILDTNLSDINAWRAALLAEPRMTTEEMSSMSDDMVELLSQEADEDSTGPDWGEN